MIIILAGDVETCAASIQENDPGVFFRSSTKENTAILPSVMRCQNAVPSQAGARLRNKRVCEGSEIQDIDYIINSFQR